MLQDIFVNIAANLIFWGLFGLVAWAIYALTFQRRFESFFGLKHDRRLVIYLSNLWDPFIKIERWGEVIAGSELHAASEIQGMITSLAPRFPGLIRGLADEILLKDRFRITIEVSQAENCLPAGNMIVIGATAKNSVRRCLLEEKRLLARISGESVTPPASVHHNPLQPGFIVTRQTGDETHEVASELAPAIIERVVIDDERDPNQRRVIFMCAGLTGFDSKIATEYLAKKWRVLELASRNKDHFARCLSLDRKGNVAHYFDVVAQE